MFDLYSYPLLMVYVVGLCGDFGPIGWRLRVEVGEQQYFYAGERHAVFLRWKAPCCISTLESAILGLLALMIAFTFSHGPVALRGSGAMRC